MSVLDLQAMAADQADDEEQMLRASEDDAERRGSGLSLLVY